MDVEKILKQLTLEEKAGLCSGADFWHTKGVERLGIPPLMMCDGPHGLRKQAGEGDHMGIGESIETVCYPTASALAASFDRNVLHRLGEALGQECQAEDVGMLLGPGINLKRSPLCGRNFEYFSEDPYLSGELGVSFVESLQEQGVASCVKHFAANNQETRRMSGNSRMDERTLYEMYLPAFETVVKKGKARGIMCAYNAINGIFAAENKELLTDILRKKWGYRGLVVTDWGAVKDRVQGLLAGLDLEMPGGSGSQDEKIVKAVQSGAIEESVLDQAVRNVLHLIDDYLSARRPESGIDRDKCVKLSEELSEQCAVLMKNEGTLPLKKGTKVAFIGEFAEKPRYQGAGSSHVHASAVTGALEAARDMGLEVTFARGYRAKDQGDHAELLAEAVATAANAEAAVVFAGLPDSYETEGCDRDTMALPEDQNRLIQEIVKVQPDTVVVLHGGSPVELPWIEDVPAVLCMYLGGQAVGRAAVKLLYGDQNPSGKIAETWPLRLEDNPSYLNFPGEEGWVEYREGIFVGYRYYDKKKMEVQFPFGHGLSYTEFEYSDFKLSHETIADTETLQVTCKVTNTGERSGMEALQLYVRDVESTAIRPVRELKGFEKIMLEPGESREVGFVLDKRAFASYEPKLHDWYVETGTFMIEIASSSRDIRLSGEVTVQGTIEKPIHYTKTSTVGDLMKTVKGREFMKQMMNPAQGRTEGNQSKGEKESMEENRMTTSMGEGSEKMAQNMMLEMPLSSIVSFGRMTEEQLEGLLEVLNA